MQQPVTTSYANILYSHFSHKAGVSIRFHDNTACLYVSMTAQHTSLYVSMTAQHTSLYVSMTAQHTSLYVSMTAQQVSQYSVGVSMFPWQHQVFVCFHGNTRCLYVSTTQQTGVSRVSTTTHSSPGVVCCG